MAEPNSARPQRKMSTAGESVYKVLGLEKGASAEDIKKAYRCVYLELHKGSLLPLVTALPVFSKPPNPDKVWTISSGTHYSAFFCLHERRQVKHSGAANPRNIWLLLL